jgi:MYXO-CTERM domain-containing protein
MRMRTLGAGLLVAACTASCGPGVPSEELTARASAAIQGGTVDSTHTFAVGLVQVGSGNQVAFCSGVLLGPNLVATARHCVTQTGSTQISCATSVFGSDVPTKNLLVTNATNLPQATNFAGVVKIITPPSSATNKVCGNDIALVVLDRNISLPQYVVPAINPPMTDHIVYSTSVTAIGYGINSPTDTTGMSAGVRRIKENISLICIPNDTHFANCFSDPTASQVISATEFMSGDASTCEGDSGSGAFEQGSFDHLQWVSFGVLSRGAVSADNQTCIEPIYSRFDAWGPLLVNAATQAATMGGYPLPVWAGGDGGAPGTAAVDAAGANSGTTGATSSSGTATLIADGQPCSSDNSCSSKNCVSLSTNFVCASDCSTQPCAQGFTCLGGVGGHYCFASTSGDTGTTPTRAHSGGCSTSFEGHPAGTPVGTLAMAMAALGLARRRRRP